VKRVSRTEFQIEQADRDEASEHANRIKGKDRKKFFYTGFLGEMVAAAYLGIDWKNSGYGEDDLTDEHNTKYQVKTTYDQDDRHHHPCEKESKWADKCDFERYIFVTLDPDDARGTVDSEMEKEMVHLNVHACPFGDGVPGLWRQSSRRQSRWRQTGDQISGAAS
jgi:hypothetical protein